MNTTSKGRRVKEKLSLRPQFNVRIPEQLKDELDAEIRRQGRKRDAVMSRVFSYFLSLKTDERDQICSRAA